MGARFGVISWNLKGFSVLLIHMHVHVLCFATTPQLKQVVKVKIVFRNRSPLQRGTPKSTADGAGCVR